MLTLQRTRPKIADYPFTTLYPALGVVPVDGDTSFVVADIPGIIEGAAEGAGLGIQFLKHLQRTGLLLHMVELPAYEGMSNPIEQFNQLSEELVKFSEQLEEKQRWLVFTKADVTTADEAELLAAEYAKAMGWEDKYYLISSINKQGLTGLIKDIAAYLFAEKDDWD